MSIQKPFSFEFRAHNLNLKLLSTTTTFVVNFLGFRWRFVRMTWKSFLFLFTKCWGCSFSVNTLVNSAAVADILLLSSVAIKNQVVNPYATLRNINSLPKISLSFLEWIMKIATTFWFVCFIFALYFKIVNCQCIYLNCSQCSLNSECGKFSEKKNCFRVSWLFSLFTNQYTLKRMVIKHDDISIDQSFLITEILKIWKNYDF